jgi:hypothetical protein
MIESCVTVMQFSRAMDNNQVAFGNSPLLSKFREHREVNIAQNLSTGQRSEVKISGL